jgi:hypothetical protein
MSKEYLRESDGFRVNDSQERPLEWVVETYGGEFVEVLPPAPPTKEELEKLAEIAERKKEL